MKALFAYWKATVRCPWKLLFSTTKNPNFPSCLSGEALQPCDRLADSPLVGPTPALRPFHAEVLRAGHSTTARGADSPRPTCMPPCFGRRPVRESNIFAATLFQNIDKAAYTSMKPLQLLPCVSSRRCGRAGPRYPRCPAWPADVAVPRGLAPRAPGRRARASRRRPGAPAAASSTGNAAGPPSCWAAASEEQLCGASPGQPAGSYPMGSTEKGLCRHGKIRKQNLRHRTRDFGHRSCSVGPTLKILKDHGHQLLLKRIAGPNPAIGNWHHKCQKRLSVAAMHPCLNSKAENQGVCVFHLAYSPC